MHVLLLLGSLNRTSVVETNPEVSFSTLKERPVFCKVYQHLTGTWYSFGPLGDRGPVSVTCSPPPPPLPPKEKKKVQERSVLYFDKEREKKGTLITHYFKNNPLFTPSVYSPSKACKWLLASASLSATPLDTVGKKTESGSPLAAF